MKKKRWLAGSLEKGDKDCFGREVTTVKLSIDKKRVYKYWEKSPLFKSFINKPYCDDIYCMACGSTRNFGQYGQLERAHITADSIGGSRKESNLHMLCRLCHLQSEDLEGWHYWLWLGLKSQLFELGTLNIHEWDYSTKEDADKGTGDLDKDKELLVPYVMKGDSEEHIKKYARDISLLYQIENNVFDEEAACIIIHNPELWGLKCTFENVDEISKIDETLHLNPMTDKSSKDYYMNKYNLIMKKIKEANQ